MIYSILPPKAEEGWIKPDQCQVNSTWLELTYYIVTLILLVKLLLIYSGESWVILAHSKISVGSINALSAKSCFILELALLQWEAVWKQH